MPKKEPKDVSVATEAEEVVVVEEPIVVVDPEIARVRNALVPPVDHDDHDELDDLAVAEPTPAPRPRKRKNVEATHLVTEECGQLNYNGTKYMAGDGLVLTSEEAAALGRAVERA